jgi:hypothetical protein
MVLEVIQALLQSYEMDEETLDAVVAVAKNTNYIPYIRREALDLLILVAKGNEAVAHTVVELADEQFFDLLKN